MDKVRSKDGTFIAYERSGKGPGLVLVHGSTADHTRWAYVLPMLEKDFTVYAVDRRGRGQSGDSSVYAIEREFEDIAVVVDSIQGSVNLLGHSFGALCSLEASLLVKNLNKLILYEPYFPVGGLTLYPTGMRERIQTLLDSGDRESALLVLFRDVAQIPEDRIAIMQKEPVWKARLAAAHTIVRESAEEDYKFDASRFIGLNVPTLLLQGSESPETLRATTEAIYAALPDSKIAVMPGQHHIAMTTAPELFVQLVTEFLMEPK